MARQINGHVGNFSTSADLISKFPPAEYMGCSANVGTTAPYIKYWCDGQTWAGVAAASVQALVSGDGIGPAVKTLAEMLAWVPTRDGTECYVSDLYSGVRGRFYYHAPSLKWRPAAMVLVDRNLTLDSGVNNTSEQYIKNVSVPAGLLFTGCEIYIEYTLARSNATDAGAAAQFRIGNAGTISDGTTTAGSGFINLSSTVRTFGNSHRYRVVSATQLQKVGTPTQVAGSFTNSSSSSAADTLLTVGDTTARLYFAPTVQLAAATGSTLPQVGYAALWLLPG